MNDEIFDFPGDHGTLFQRVIAEIDPMLYTGRKPDADGLVYCCVTLGRVTPAEAADHLWDYPKEAA